MPRQILTLYELCLNETAVLLKSSYWNTNFPFGCNPFVLIPSSIVDALIVQVTRISMGVTVDSSDLRPLLTSGQVREFILEDVYLNAECLQEIFLDLSAACQNVVKIKIKNVSCNIVQRMNLYMKTHALNCLLSEARNVKYVESCIEFNLEMLSNAVQLQTLILLFPVKDHVFEFLEVNGQLMPNMSLKHLEIFEDAKHPISYLDIAVILRYCTELRHIDCDISNSLEYLHAEELISGSINTIYKIEKCCLGSTHVSSRYAAATRDAIYIASLTCPFLKDVSVLVNDSQALYALSDFRNLKTLLIQWEKMEFGDFSIGVQLVLEKPEIGPNLTSLDILNFTNVDFSSIGKCCPNLESLRVEYQYEFNRHEFLPTSFQKLKDLHLENIDDRDCQVDTIMGIAANATGLKSLAIVPAGELTDVVVRAILKKNSLSNVKELRLSSCVLSLDGIRCLVSSLTDLEYFDIGLTQLDLEEVANVIHEINLRVVVSSTSEFV